MMTREGIKAIYDQGPETVSALVAQLWALMEQQQAQSVHLQARVKELQDRLAQYRTETPAFMPAFAVPCDNNVAERDLPRMQVTHKVSGCYPPPPGAHACRGIRSYLWPMKRQGHQVLAALKRVFSGSPLVPNVPG